MKLSNEQKLIIAMLASIQRKLCITEDHDAVDPDFVLGAIYQKQEWAIPARYTGLFSAEATPPVVGAVRDHLSMWVALEQCYADLSTVEQGRVAAAVEPSRMPVRFPGYDAKHEQDHLAVTRFIIEHMHTHAALADRPDYIAGRRMLPQYDAMIEIYRDELQSTGATPLSAEQLIRVLQAAG